MITGRVTDALNGRPIAGAVVTVDREGQGGTADADGRYVVRDVSSGYHRLTARAAGFRPASRDSVLVTAGRSVVVDFALAADAIPLPAVEVEAAPDALLDPRAPQTSQTIDAAELRELPVTTLAEAIALQAGVVQGSFRGGRLGQELLVVDGLGVKNQLDAASGRLGLRIPTVALEEATLVTNGFSAQYGQALSGIVAVTTRDGGDQLEGRAAFETDRSLPAGWNVGLDRLSLSLGGPVLGPVRFVAAFEAEARIDDDPANAPAPSDTLDPRANQPHLLPHNAGERFDVFGKLTIPVGQRETIRLLGLASTSRRLLFDPELKYASLQGPGERLSTRLALLHVRRTSAPEARTVVNADLRAGYFEKEAIRAPLLEQPTSRFGGFAFASLMLAGEDVAAQRDTVRAFNPLEGFEQPAFASNTPWGVPAFFMTASPRGELTWNRFREARIRLDVLVGPGTDTDLRVGAEYVNQRVETFTRLEAYRAVADGGLAPVSASFAPMQMAGYVELQQRTTDVTLTAGLRADAFDGRSRAGGGVSGMKLAVGPRLAVSTVLGPAIVVASWGRSAQPPDFQYLVDAAFDDTVRTGRFRRGNPGLGFETATQYELQVRARLASRVGIRVGAYVRRLDGLIASVPLGVDPDSAIFGNADFGNVKGLELSVERELRGNLGWRVTYVVQHAAATATDARDLFRRLQITPLGDTIVPATVEFPLDFDRRHSIVVVARARAPRALGSVLAGTEASIIGRWSSGLPFTQTNVTGDSLIGLPNSQRLPHQESLDLLIRRVIRFGSWRLGLFADVRNVLDRRNVVAVRRDSGEPFATDGQIAAMAESAYLANPHAIPYESPRYRAWADANGDGLVSGRTELLPLFERAARDIAQPLFSYGSPRLLRFGVEVLF
jgi:outer membrane receptor protein involved in Fe transport